MTIRFDLGVAEPLRLWEMGQKAGDPPWLRFVARPPETESTVTFALPPTPESRSPSCFLWSLEAVVLRPQLLDTIIAMRPLFERLVSIMYTDPSHDDSSYLAWADDPDAIPPEARTLWHDIASRLAAELAEAPRVEVHPLDSAALRAQLDGVITAHTTDSDITAHVEAVQAQTPPSTPGNEVVIPGLSTLLHELRTHAQQHDLHRLAELDHQARAALAARDDMVRHISGWAQDPSHRAVRDVLHLTPEAVEAIVRRGALSDTTAHALDDANWATLSALETSGSGTTTMPPLDLGYETTEQWWQRRQCDHPIAEDRAQFTADGARIPIRPIGEVPVSTRDMSAALRLAVCSVCGAPVVVVDLASPHGAWATTYTALRRDGHPQLGSERTATRVIRATRSAAAPSTGPRPELGGSHQPRRRHDRCQCGDCGTG